MLGSENSKGQNINAKENRTVLLTVPTSDNIKLHASELMSD